MASESKILDDLHEAAHRDGEWGSLLPILAPSAHAPGVHLAIMVEPFLGYIMAGTKTIESRFSKNCIAPYQRITEGDLVLLKQAAGPIVGCFIAASVECVELDDEQRARLRHDYSAAICADDDFWQARADKRYATLIGIRAVQQLSPFKVTKSDRRGWIVLRLHQQTDTQLSLI